MNPKVKAFIHKAALELPAKLEAAIKDIKIDELVFDTLSDAPRVNMRVLGKHNTINPGKQFFIMPWVDERSILMGYDDKIMRDWMGMVRSSAHDLGFELTS